MPDGHSSHAVMWQIGGQQTTNNISSEAGSGWVWRVVLIARVRCCSVTDTGLPFSCMSRFLARLRRWRRRRLGANLSSSWTDTYVWADELRGRARVFPRSPGSNSIHASILRVWSQRPDDIRRIYRARWRTCQRPDRRFLCKANRRVGGRARKRRGDRLTALATVEFDLAEGSDGETSSAGVPEPGRTSSRRRQGEKNTTRPS